MSGANEAEFMGITGANETAARQILEMCGGDLEQSIMLWYADEELQRSLSTPATSSAAITSDTAAGTSSGQSRQARRQAARQIGREDERGVIHIDSDDEDVTMTDVEDFDDDDDDGVASAVRRAQEQEDAAVAQSLQEELYRNVPATDEADQVRAPMARTTETLVEPSYGGGFGEAHDAILEQLHRRQRAQGMLFPLLPNNLVIL